MAKLTQEIAAYERMREDLESEHHGRWALVHEEQSADTYASFELAAEDALDQFGRGPYVIREVGGPAHNFDFEAATLAETQGRGSETVEFYVEDKRGRRCTYLELQHWIRTRLRFR